MDQIIDAWEWIKPLLALRSPDAPLPPELIFDQDAQDLLACLKQALATSNLTEVDRVIQEMEYLIFYLLPSPSSRLPKNLAGRVKSWPQVRYRPWGRVKTAIFPPVQVRRRRSSYRCYQAVELGLQAIHALLQIGQAEYARDLAERLWAAHALSLDPSPNRLVINLAVEVTARWRKFQVDAQVAHDNEKDDYCWEIHNRANYDRNRTFFKHGGTLFPPQPVKRKQASAQVASATAATPSPGVFLVQPVVPTPVTAPYHGSQNHLNQKGSLRWDIRTRLPRGGDIIYSLEINQVWVQGRVFDLIFLESGEWGEYHVDHHYTLARVTDANGWQAEFLPGSLLMIDRSNPSAEANRPIVIESDSSGDRQLALASQPSGKQERSGWLRLFHLRKQHSCGAAMIILCKAPRQPAPKAALRLPVDGPVVIGPPQTDPSNRSLAIKYIEASQVDIDGISCEVKPLRGQAYYLVDPKAEYYLMRVLNARPGAVISADEFLLVKAYAFPDNGDYVVVESSDPRARPDLEGDRLLRQYFLQNGRIELRPNQAQPPSPTRYYSPDQVKKELRGVVVVRFSRVQR